MARESPPRIGRIERNRARIDRRPPFRMEPEEAGAPRRVGKGGRPGKRGSLPAGRPGCQCSKQGFCFHISGAATLRCPSPEAPWNRNDGALGGASPCYSADSNRVVTSPPPRPVDRPFPDSVRTTRESLSPSRVALVLSDRLSLSTTTDIQISSCRRESG